MKNGKWKIIKNWRKWKLNWNYNIVNGKNRKWKNRKWKSESQLQTYIKNIVNGN